MLTTALAAILITLATVFAVAWKINSLLNRILRKLNQGERLMSQESDAISALTAQVTAQTSVEQSAITLIEGLAAQIAAAGTDPAALTTLTAQLASSAQALSAAVAANTVAAPAPTPPAA